MSNDVLSALEQRIVNDAVAVVRTDFQNHLWALELKLANQTGAAKYYMSPFLTAAGHRVDYKTLLDALPHAMAESCRATIGAKAIDAFVKKAMT